MRQSEIDRRAFMRRMASLAAVAGAGACRPTDALTGLSLVGAPNGADASRLEWRRRTHTPLNNPMKYYAQQRGITFGIGADVPTFFDPPLLDEMARESGMVVPIAQGDWMNTHPGPTTWDFSDMDGMWTWAQSVGIPMRGTHLVTHKDLPPWFFTDVTSANAAQVMQDHINMIMTHFQGLFHSWNAVNEAVFPADGRPDGLRNSPWMQLLGPQFISMAFDFAHQADPSAVLSYNEYGLEDASSWGTQRRKVCLRMLRNLVRSGVPIHALAMQAHLSSDTIIGPGTLKEFMDDVASLGLRIFISELDVKDWNLPANFEQRDAGVAAQYYSFLNMVLAHPAVDTLIIWGLSDRNTWLTWNAPRQDGLPVRVLPYDDLMNRKDAWLAICDALAGR